jgi:hypothetical protein
VSLENCSCGRRVERGAVQPRTAGVVSLQQTPAAEKSPDVSKAEFGWGPVRTTDW